MRYQYIIALFMLLSQLSWAQTRAISKINGDLYRFQHNAHYSVFLVTPEGILVTDPIDNEAATWLNQELLSRFGIPVTHLVYSHDHADHISGGGAFGDQVQVIGHRLTKEAIIREKRNVPIPQITFEDQYTIELGGHRVELYYPGLSHGDNCIIMLFPVQRAVFVVDFITVNRLPYRDLGGGHMPGWVDAIKSVEALDFDILAPGHGAIGTKADATNHRLYLEALRDAVSSGLSNGQTLEDMQKTIQLNEYSHFGNYNEWLPLNIEGMYNMLR